MSVPRSVAEVLNEHVTLEVEGIDRMYLNVYVPQLQREQGVATFFRSHLGHRFASSVLMDPISKRFAGDLESFARQEQIPVIQFRKGERKDDIAAGYRKKSANRKAWCSSVKRRRRCRSSAPNGGRAKALAQRTRGWCVRQRWSTSSMSTAWTATSAPSF